MYSLQCSGKLWSVLSKRLSWVCRMAAADSEKIALVVIDAQYDFMPGGSLVCIERWMEDGEGGERVKGG